MSQFIESYNEEFNKLVNHFKEEIERLKAGRANPMLLDGVVVDSYGVKTPLKQVASISVPESSMLVIEPWDKSLLKEVEKGISMADLDLSLSVSENVVRAKIQPLTEEKRINIVKILHEKRENAKVSLRQLREKIKKITEQQEKDKEISEDEKFDYVKELDELVKSKSQNVDEISKKKEEEIMTI